MALTNLHDKAMPAATPLQDTQSSDGGQSNQATRPKRNFLTSQEHNNEEETQEMSFRKRTRISKQPALEAGNELPQDTTSLILASEKDNQVFFQMTNHPSATLKTIRNLDIHLDTKKLDEYAAYRLALALAELHPRRDGQNPHHLHTTRLIVNGNILFTRYSYSLMSPASSDLVSQNLKKFLAGGLIKEEKAKLAFKLNSTETLVAKALLGIRGITRVIIDGKGKMEGCFAETLKATMIQPPGTTVAEVEDPILPYSTPDMSRVGTFNSEAYAQTALRPYPTRPIATKYDFSSLKARDRYLVDERAQLLHHFLDLPEDNRPSFGASTTARSVRRSLPEFDVSSAQDLQRNARKRKQDQDNGLGMSDMIRIRAREQGMEPVELGWKV